MTPDEPMPGDQAAPDAPHVLVDALDGVLRITFNRPAKANALSPEAIVRLADAWVRLRDDDGLLVALVTGAGPRVFTAGADLGTLIPLLGGTRPPADGWDERLVAEPGLVDVALLTGLELYKPVVAAVNGLAYGAGTELLQATDLRVAASTARFGLPEVRRGIVPAGGSMVRLARQVPWCLAMELLLTGADVSADEAWRMGLVNRVVPPEEVLAEAERFVAAIAANGPVAVRAVKEAVVRTSGIPLADAFAVQARLGARVMRSEDAVEGPLAFVERRPPRFTGR